MLDLTNKTIAELIDPRGFDCGCGKRHAVSIKYVKTGRGVLGCVPEMIAALGAKKPFVLCDKSTYKAAGEKVCEILKDAGIPYTLYVLPVDKPAPDEWTIGNVLMRFDMSCDLVLGVGSGVINDTCKELAFKTGRENAIVGTAPSMDGFASATSSMELDHVKVSLNNQCPQGILLDADILAQAPMRMLWAGFGDMVAKFVAICEWRITNLITGEYYCEAIADLMRAALKKIMARADKITSRDPDALLDIADGLVIAGLGMAFAGCSRPASGIEHYFSHMWEMMALERGEESDLHGIQVGVGSYLTFKLYEKIKKLTPDREKALNWMKNFDSAKWESETKRVFGSVAPGILETAAKEGRNDPAKHAERVEKIVSNWDKILQIIDEELPTFERIMEIMTVSGMPIRPAELGVSEEDVHDALCASRDIRNKYISSTMLWDLGLLYEMADEFDGK